MSLLLGDPLITKLVLSLSATTTRGTCFTFSAARKVVLEAIHRFDEDIQTFAPLEMLAPTHAAIPSAPPSNRFSKSFRDLHLRVEP